jgi:hypothetical protein
MDGHREGKLHLFSCVSHLVDPMSHRIALLAVVMVGAVGCVPLRHDDGLKPAHLERLYFGRNIGDTAVVSDSAWVAFVRNVVTPAFPEGSTVWESAGQWRAPDGTMVKERGYVVELLHLVTPDVETRVQRVIDSYKKQFSQQSVLRIVTNVRATF